MSSEQADGGQTDGVRRVHDPRVLRGLAHPVRNRILTELAASGALRAADIARELDIPANQASFHLRQLAKYGLVEEAPDEARDRRDRVWRMSSERGFTVSFREIEEEPGGRAAVSVFRRTATAWAQALVERAYADEPDPDTHRTVTDMPLRLTKDEAEQLSHELDDLVQTWAARTRGRDDGRRTYSLFSVLQPYPAPEAGGSPSAPPAAETVPEQQEQSD